MNWQFTSLPKVICQRGGRHQLGTWLAELGKRVLFVRGRTTPERSIQFDEVQASICDAGLELHAWTQLGEPTVEDVDAGAAFARSRQVDAIVALGGGSVIDVAKAIGAVVANGGTALDYLEVVGAGKQPSQPALPLIAVPVTAGAGSEGTRNAVLKVTSHAVKVSMRGEQLRPRIALLDAELCLGVPPDVTAATGLDCLTQLIESFTSCNAQPLTDAWCLDGIRRVALALPRAYHDGHDIDAREQMCVAALQGGLCLGNAGLGAVHGFAGPLGGRFPIPHGVACAALLVPVLNANFTAAKEHEQQNEKHKASVLLDRYATLGRILTQQPELNSQQAIERMQDRCQEFVTDFNVPRLSQFGIQRSDFADLVESAKRSSSMKYNPVPLSDAQLMQCLEQAF